MTSHDLGLLALISIALLLLELLLRLELLRMELLLLLELRLLLELLGVSWLVIALLLLQEGTLVVSLRSSCYHQSQVVDAASHPLKVEHGT